MAVALTIVLRVFGSGVNNAVVSEEYTIAVQIAESLLATTGVEAPLIAGIHEGIEGDKYFWQIEINPANPKAAQHRFKKSDVSDEAPPPPQLVAVKVRVNWGDEDTPRSVTLNTIKLKSPPKDE